MTASFCAHQCKCQVSICMQFYNQDSPSLLKKNPTGFFERCKPHSLIRLKQLRIGQSVADWPLMMSRLQDVDVQHCPTVSAMLGTMIPTTQIIKSVIAISIELDGPLSLSVEPEHGKEDLPVPVARTSCMGRQLPFCFVWLELWKLMEK